MDIRLRFLLIGIILSLGLIENNITAATFGYNNPNLPQLTPQVTTSSSITNDYINPTRTNRILIGGTRGGSRTKSFTPRFNVSVKTPRGFKSLGQSSSINKAFSIGTSRVRRTLRQHIHISESVTPMMNGKQKGSSKLNPFSWGSK